MKRKTLKNFWVLNKHRLDYNPFSTKKTSKTIFVKHRFSKDDACSYCGINGHYAYSCKLRQLRIVGIKRIWVSKGTFLRNLVITDQKGPKKLGYQFQKFDISLQVCMSAKTKKNKWYLDSDCSHLMNRDKAKFSTISPKDGGYFIFGDNSKGKIIGEGKVSKSPNPTIDDVLLVNGLKHNLLSISQFCDKNCKVIFEPNKFVIFDDNECALFVGFGHNNIYIVNLFDSKAFNKKCHVSVNDDIWL